MSSNIFRKEAYGLYYYFKQLIEIRNDVLGVEDERAVELVNTCGLNILNDKDLNFYKTYIHESVHFLDSTSTMWGVEYSIRLFNCLVNKNAMNFVNVFLLNHSEIDQHLSRKLTQGKKNIKYRAMRSILSYDLNHGVHILFKYYDIEGKNFIEDFSVPLSMLALLEGHAFAQEQLAALSIMKSNHDLVSIKILEQAYKNILCDACLSEYTCILAFADFLFETYSFEKKLLIVIYTCRVALELPTLFPFPESYIDAFFSKSKPELVSALKMEFSRGMNRSSLAALILIALSFSFEKYPIDEKSSFPKELEDRIFKIFLKDGQDLEQCKSSFRVLRSLEYDYACTILRDKGALLAYKSATANKEWKWLYEMDKVELPSVLLTTGMFIPAKNNIDYDMEAHFFSSDKLINELSDIIDGNAIKPHLRPEFCHEWLNEMKLSKYGLSEQ